jgi:hypothetical protein
MITTDIQRGMRNGDLVMNTVLQDVRAGAAGHANQGAVCEGTIFGAAYFIKSFIFGFLLNKN